VFSEENIKEIAAEVRGAYAEDHNNLTLTGVEELVVKVLRRNSSEEGESVGSSDVNLPSDNTMKKLALSIKANPNRKGTSIIDMLALIISNITSIFSSAQTRG